MKNLIEMAGGDQPLFGTWISIPDPNVVEMAHRAGFDYIRIDNEYTPLDFGKMCELIRAANLLDMPVFVRISRMEDITSLISFGASGIIVPDCNSVERARQAINLIKYHSLGARGLNPGSRAFQISGLSGEEYIRRANRMVSLTIQIEDVKVAGFIDELLSLEGIDMVSSGRCDISQSLGVTGQVKDPRVREMEMLIIDKALEHGKVPVILISAREELAGMLARGVRVFTVGNDEVLLRNAMKRCLDEYR